MAFNSIFVICILAVFSIATAQMSAACRKAYKSCDFKFAGKGSIPSFSINGKADRSFTRRIVAKNGMRVGVFNSNGREPEFINVNGATVPISKAVAAKQPFTPTHFKPFYMKKQRGSGIGHQTFHKNQKKVARGRCVRVYFTEYQTLKSRYPFVVKKNIKTSRRSSCVVFLTY